MSVATLMNFWRQWLPDILALDLKWIALFESGCVLSSEDHPFVQAELLQLRTWLSTRETSETDDAEAAQRLDRLSAEMIRAAFNPAAWPQIRAQLSTSVSSRDDNNDTVRRIDLLLAQIEAALPFQDAERSVG